MPNSRDYWWTQVMSRWENFWVNRHMWMKCLRPRGMIWPPSTLDRTTHTSRCKVVQGRLRHTTPIKQKPSLELMTTTVLEMTPFMWMQLYRQSSWRLAVNREFPNQNWVMSVKRRKNHPYSQHIQCHLQVFFRHSLCIIRYSSATITTIWVRCRCCIINCNW